MKNKLKITIFIALCITLLSSSIIFAYYVNTHTASLNNQKIGITEETIQEISSFEDLIKYGTASEYNDYNKVSNVSDRKVLRLTKNITLTNNVMITNDIHLDLNGNTLNLNDYELVFKHRYSGCFTLYNGTIQSGKNSLGKIIIDLPNAGCELDSKLTFKKFNDDTTSSQEEIVTITNINPIYTAYSALYLAANAFASDLNSRPVFKKFNEVTASFTPDLFVNKKKCSYNSNTEEACSFVYKELDLIDHYLSTDIKISYSSSNESIINNYGELGGSYGDVNLTIIVSKEGWQNSYSCSFLLHVVNLSDSEVRQKVGFALIEAYLRDYYVGESLIIKNQVILSDYYYRFNQAINLPKTVLGEVGYNEDGTENLTNAISYTYSTTNLDNSPRESSIIPILDNGITKAYIFAPTISDYHLVVTIDGLSKSYNMYSTYVGLEETIAYYIANNLYGGSIIYDKAASEKTLITYNDINTDDSYSNLRSYLTTYGVTNITYSLYSNASSHYYIEENALKVNSSSVPPDKEGYVTMSIYFGETKHYDIDLYVEYLDANGTTLSSYLTYYSIYNASVPSELETSFNLPFCTNNLAPYTCYDVATYETKEVTIDGKKYISIKPTLFKPANLKIELWYDSKCQFVFEKYDSNTAESFTNQLDAYLKGKPLTLQELATKNAYYRFSIDAQNSLPENTKLVIIYNYKFNANDASWTRYENTLENAKLTDSNTTYLTVLGGLFYNTNGTNASDEVVDNAVKDSNFFVWIYNKFRPQTSEPDYSDINSASSDMIIPIDWLGQSAKITKDDSALKDVNDFSGIKYLTGITEADLRGSSISGNVLTAISEMKSIKSLNLSGCNLDSVSSLSKLSKQGTLKILDISNNNIQYFEEITTITSLEKVYLYGNYVNNGYYGSKGICNFQAFADLMRNGCSVYNDISNKAPVLYAESNNLDDYRRLKEIAYQSTLKKGLDIRNLYSQFENLGTTITGVSGDGRPGSNPFGLQTAGTLSWGYEGDANEGDKYQVATVKVGDNISNTYYELINGSYTQTSDTTIVEGKTYYVKVDATNATYFYVTLTYTSKYVLKVKYYVDRY